MKYCKRERWLWTRRDGSDLRIRVNIASFVNFNFVPPLEFPIITLDPVPYSVVNGFH